MRTPANAIAYSRLEVGAGGCKPPAFEGSAVHSPVDRYIKRRGCPRGGQLSPACPLCRGEASVKLPLPSNRCGLRAPRWPSGYSGPQCMSIAMSRSRRFQFDSLHVEMQHHIIGMLPLETRYYATLLSRSLRSYSDVQVLLIRRVARLVASKSVQKERRTTLELSRKVVAQYYAWPPYRRIWIRGVAGDWRVSSSLGSQDTDLKTPDVRSLMLEVMRLLPKLESTGETGGAVALGRGGRPLAREEGAVNVIRLSQRYYVTHVFLGPSMQLQCSDWNVPDGGSSSSVQSRSGAIHAAPGRWYARLEAIVRSLEYTDWVYVLHQGRGGRTMICRDSSLPTVPSLSMSEYSLETYHRVLIKFEDASELLRHVSGAPRFKPAMITLVKCGCEKSHYQYPDFEYRPPAWAV